MIYVKDYEALAAVLLHNKPRLIFEIGTYLGVTSDLFLELLPECRVVSIAYINRRWGFSGKYNTSELSRKEIGSAVDKSRRSRFTQLFGNSHKLKAQDLVRDFDRFDMVFIDGDHSRAGVSQDTELAKQIIAESGVICWHDANPKPKYMEVRQFLEGELGLKAIATKDECVGGIACWSLAIERELNQHLNTAQQFALADGGIGGQVAC